MRWRRVAPWPLRRWAPLAFQQGRIEAAFCAAHDRTHAQLDPLGFAFALCWCAAAAFRLGGVLSGIQQAALAVLAGATAAAAILQALAPETYLARRGTILSALRLWLAAAAAAATPLATQRLQAGRACVWGLLLLQGGQHLLLAFAAMTWRLRTQLHLPLQLACVVIVAAANGRLSTAIAASSAAAAAVSSSLAAVLGPAAAAALSPERAVTAACVALQVVLGFYMPSGRLLAAESRERAAFLPAHLYQTALRFEQGVHALGIRRRLQPAPARRNAWSFGPRSSFDAAAARLSSLTQQLAAKL